MAAVAWEMHYDRRVSPGFLAHFSPGGFAASLAEYAKHARYPVDLQLRSSPKAKGQEHATLYVGLTAVLNVKRRGDRVSLDAHPTIQGDPALHFDEAWNQPTEVDVLDREWARVEGYLEAAIPVVSARAATPENASNEGLVQAAVSSFVSTDRVMLDREAAMHFRDTTTKKQVFDEITGPLVEVISGLRDIPGKPKVTYGGECDLLAMDAAGRLLTVEVKPSNVGSIVWSGVQAAVYAKLFERWLATPTAPGLDPPSTVIQGMLDQRRKLRLAPRGTIGVGAVPTVVPVVALRRGANQDYVKRLKKVNAALLDAGCLKAEPELYSVSLAGRLDPLH